MSGAISSGLPRPDWYDDLRAWVERQDPPHRSALQRACRESDSTQPARIDAFAPGADIPLLFHHDMYALAESAVDADGNPMRVAGKLSLINAAFWLSQRQDERAGRALDAFTAILRGQTGFAEIYLTESVAKDRTFANGNLTGDRFFIDDVVAGMASGAVALAAAATTPVSNTRHALLNTAKRHAAWVEMSAQRAMGVGGNDLFARFAQRIGDGADTIAAATGIALAKLDDKSPVFDVPVIMSRESELPSDIVSATKMPIFVPAENTYAVNDYEMGTILHAYTFIESVVLAEINKQLLSLRFRSPVRATEVLIAMIYKYWRRTCASCAWAAFAAIGQKDLALARMSIDALTSSSHVDAVTDATANFFPAFHHLIAAALCYHASFLTEDPHVRGTLLGKSGAVKSIRKAMRLLNKQLLTPTLREYVLYLHNTVSYENFRLMRDGGGGSPQDGGSGKGVDINQTARMKAIRSPAVLGPEGTKGPSAAVMPTIPQLTPVAPTRLTI